MRSLPLLACLIFAFAACGDGPTGFVAALDAAGETLDTGLTPDASASDDAEPSSDASETLPEGCTRGNFPTTSVQVTADGSNINYRAFSATTEPFDMMSIQSLADWNGPTEPGRYALDGINYLDCGLCLLAYADCAGTECAKTFYADAGDVVIDAIGMNEGERFAGTLENVVFREVTIDADYVSTPVPGGDSWCMNGLEFEGFAASAPQAGECDPDAYDCIGETLSTFELQSCDTGEMVEVSALNAEHKGTWMILTAGWCSACHAWLPQVFGVLDDELAAEDLNLMVVLGENTSGEAPSLEYCRAYAEQYGHGLENFYMDHSGSQSFATVFSKVWIYPGAGGSFGLPWNGMFRGDGEYVYADGADPAADVNVGLNLMLNP